MKRIFAMALAVLTLVGLLAGCGSSESKTVDLTAFYDSLAEQYTWEGNYMVDLTDDMLESYYPGITAIGTKQLVAKVPQMSSVVNELVFVECENEDDVAKVEEILQKRVDDQASGGAWYPESMASWSNAQVLTEGNYVALIASAEHQDEIEKSFTALFA